MRKIKELKDISLSIRNICILDYLSSSKHDSVKMVLIDFLGKTKEEKAIHKLLDALNHNSYEIKEKV